MAKRYKTYGFFSDYFGWLVNSISGYAPLNQTILKILFDREFEYTIELDGNRARDGIDLRTRYCRENDLNDGYIDRIMFRSECSILEMMVAMSFRADEIMGNYESDDDGPSRWFFEMWQNLGFDRFGHDPDPYQVTDILDRFVDREYEPDGLGGPFYIPECDRDLRHVELWYQMLWYLDQYVV